MRKIWVCGTGLPVHCKGCYAEAQGTARRRGASGIWCLRKCASHSLCKEACSKVYQFLLLIKCCVGYLHVGLSVGLLLIIRTCRELCKSAIEGIAGAAS
jgi:hypothetical protein